MLSILHVGHAQGEAEAILTLIGLFLSGVGVAAALLALQAAFRKRAGRSPAQPSASSACNRANQTDGVPICAESRTGDR